MRTVIGCRLKFASVALMCTATLLFSAITVAAQTADYFHQKPVNGQCGASNGDDLTSKPRTGLCKAGTSSSVSGTGPWSWTCKGVSGGSTASCSAPLAATPTP